MEKGGNLVKRNFVPDFILVFTYLLAFLIGVKGNLVFALGIFAALFSYLLFRSYKHRTWQLHFPGILAAGFLTFWFFPGPISEIFISASIFPQITMISMGVFVIYLIYSQNRLIKKVEKKSRQLTAIFEHAPVGILLLDEERKILSINRFTESLLGYAKNELIGKKVDMLLSKRCFEKRKDHFSDGLEVFFKNKLKDSEIDAYALKKDNSEVPVGISIGNVGLEGRQSLLVFVADFTERAKIKERLILEKEFTQRLNDKLEAKVGERTGKMEEALVKLEKSNSSLRESEKKLQLALSKEKELGELKSRFVTMASHEFRTPLTTILSSLFLLENSKEEDQERLRKFHFEWIRKSTKNLIEILNDFLSLSRLEEGKVEPSYHVTDVTGLIKEVTEDINAVKKEGQNIVYTHFGNSEQLWADEKILRNILINLLSNAIKFSPPSGKIEVFSHLDKDTLKIEITDQGIGIPDEEKKHLFNRFFRANNAQNIEGTGLGLSIVKKYVDLMGGDIELSSEINKGTKFTVSLPNQIIEYA
jgi:PAS domain S-box-containing protein